jgi:hypothetical protein
MKRRVWAAALGMGLIGGACSTTDSAGGGGSTGTSTTGATTSATSGATTSATSGATTSAATSATSATSTTAATTTASTGTGAMGCTAIDKITFDMVGGPCDTCVDAHCCAGVDQCTMNGTNAQGCVDDDTTFVNCANDCMANDPQCMTQTCIDCVDACHQAAALAGSLITCLVNSCDGQCNIFYPADTSG